MKKIKLCLSVAFLLSVIFFLARIYEMRAINHVYHNLSYKTIEEIKSASKAENAYSISTKQSENKTYYVLQIKGVFYTKDIENLSFKSNKIDIKDIPDYKDKILTMDNLSIVDLTFKLETQPTEVTFNNKSIKDTNISIKDFNKVKDNIEKYSNKLRDINNTEFDEYFLSLFRMFGVMFVAVGLLPLSIVLTLIAAYDCDKED